MTSQNLLATLTRPIEPVRLTAAYRISNLVTALLMVLMPLLYWAFIAGIAFSVYYYFTTFPFDPGNLRRGKAIAGAFVFYLGYPALAIVVLIALLKPLFAPAVPRVKPLLLARNQESVLYAYVDRLCELLGAPKPVAIHLDNEVNASASFADDKISRGLVLTLGAPLVAGMSLAQLAGVMAHEIGHFNQRSALRSVRLIREVNLFFYRLAYERDAFDHWLEKTTQEDDSLIEVVFRFLGRCLVWLTRRIFIGLAWLGQALSSFQLRQMELDADRYEIRLAGADVFAATIEDLQLLTFASHQTLGSLEELWSDGNLPDNLPQLTMRTRGAMDPELQSEIRRAIQESKVGLFSTHPSDQDRLRNAERETPNTPVFQEPASAADTATPATALFRNFSALERLVTRAYYCTVLGEAVRSEALIAVEESGQRLDQSASERQALLRYLRGNVSTLWPLAVAPVKPGTTLVELEAARRSLPTVEYTNELVDGHNEAWSAVIRTSQAEALMAFGLPIDQDALELPGFSQGQVLAHQGQAQRRMATIEGQLASIETARSNRLACALGLLADHDTAEKIDADGTVRKEAAQLLEIQMLMGPLFKGCSELIRDQAVLVVLAKAYGENQENAPLQRRMGSLAGRLQSRLVQLAKALSGIEYPFQRQQEGMTLEGFIMVLPGDDADLGDYLEASSQTLDQFYETYFRVAGRLAFIGEHLEQELGLEPLPLPSNSGWV